MIWTTRVRCTGQPRSPGCNSFASARIHDFFLDMIPARNGGTRKAILHRCPKCAVETPVPDSYFPAQQRGLILTRKAHIAREITQSRQQIERSFSIDALHKATAQPIDDVARDAFMSVVTHGIHGNRPVAAFRRLEGKIIPLDWFRLADHLKDHVRSISKVLSKLDESSAEILVASKGEDLWIFDAQTGPYVLRNGLPA